MTDTENLEIRGTTYTIKRFGFMEGAEVDEFIATHKDNPIECQAYYVFRGTVSPAFENFDAVKVADREVVYHLWYALQKFNTYEMDFLSVLKNSS